MGKGQNTQGFEWQRYHIFHVFHLNQRFFTIRSPFLVKGKPTCLVDSYNYGGSNTRELFAMQCNMAAYMADGREIFGQNAISEY